MHKRGWRVEVLSWRHSCNQGMRRWAEANGVFVALDEHYEGITFASRRVRVMSSRRRGIERRSI